MGNSMDFHSLSVILREVQDYFLYHVLAWSMLAQIIVVAAAFLAAHLAAQAIRPWLKRLLARHTWIEHALGHLARLIFIRLTTAMIMIGLLWIIFEIAYYYQLPRHGIRTGLSLLLAWVIIRLLTGQMKNRTWAKIISVAIWMIAALDIVHLLGPALDFLNSLEFAIGEVHLTVLSTLQGVLILVVLLWLARKILKIFEHWITRVEHVTPSVQVLLHKLLKITLFTLAVVIVLYHLGINLTAFAVFSGALGLGLGFGLQKVISNLISGLIILADKSIKPGDVIQLGETYGWINFLGGRYISVVTRDATEYLIPNEDLITGKVINWSYSNNLLRLKVPVGIAYDSDLEEAMGLMLEAAAASPRVLADPKPACLLVGFGENAINLQLRAWIRDPQNGVTNIKSELLLGIWRRFREHDIELPFPQRVLYHKSVPELEVALRPARETGVPPEADGLQFT
jgi:small-conductance mechanosensitive channel